MRSGNDPAVLIGLQSAAIRTVLQANFEQLLQEMVFSQSTPHLDLKAAQHHKRLLRTQDARLVLEIIWKEFLPDMELESVGIRRVFPLGKLNSYRLATYLAGSSPQLVAKLNSQIRSISIAASDYGLIQKELGNDRQNYHHLTPTALLHSFMITLGQRDSYTIRTFSADGSRARLQAYGSEHQGQDEPR